MLYAVVREDEVVGEVHQWFRRTLENQPHANCFWILYDYFSGSRGCRILRPLCKKTKIRAHGVREAPKKSKYAEPPPTGQYLGGWREP